MDLAVEIDLGALHFQSNQLAEFVRQDAHDARELQPSIAAPLHARFHHAFLQSGGELGTAVLCGPRCGS